MTVAASQPTARDSGNQPEHSWSRPTSTLLSLIVAAVLPMAASAALLMGLLETQVREAKEQELLGVVRALSGSIDAELQAAVRFADALAATENVARGDYTRFDAGIRRMLATQPQYTSILVTDLPSATYLAHTSLPPQTTGPAGPVALEQSHKVALSGKTTIFGIRPTGPTIPDLIIPIRAPIVRDGKITQTLTVTLSPTYLAGVFRNANFDTGRTVSVIDQTLSVAARNRFSDQFIGRKVSPLLEQQLQGPAEGLFKNIDLEGRPVTTVYVRSAATGWSVVAGLPAAEVDDAVRLVIAPLVMGGGLAGAIGIGIAAYFALRLRRAHAVEQAFSQFLEKLVVERTVALRDSERRLYEAQKMEAIGKLTGGMAHDFNNYLGIIIGNLDLLKLREGMDAKAVDLIDEALGGAVRRAELTRSLLAYSRRQLLNPKISDLNASLESIANLLKRLIGEDIALTKALAPNLWPVRADAAQLDSCIVNLANNARDAMPHGGSLTIAARNVHLDAAETAGEDVPAGDYVAIEVSDTGSGMSQETAAHAFEPFFSTKPIGHGTGLGLSMVYGFVRQSGGITKIRSQAGLGTTVGIYLPRAQADDRRADLISGTAAQAPA